MYFINIFQIIKVSKIMYIYINITLLEVNYPYHAFEKVLKTIFVLVSKIIR